ncbi:MAG TPA: SAVED domain-containing protein, partial [Thermoanaerobaculia bacterium]|nr:SAVED domain-containing protein [Thermoanaerobaculia bacterium]
LNACRSGLMPRYRGLDPFSSTALALVQAGVPAVIAMQAPISDDAAIAFGSTFYNRIAARDPVDSALVQGRLAILRTLPFDWGTPVLFTRVPDCDILGPAAKASPQDAPGSCHSRRAVPLRLGVRTFSETPGKVLWGQEMEEECDEILDLRSCFTGPGGRYPKNPADWETEIGPRLQEFLQGAISLQRPIHLNFANHSTLAFAAGYFLEGKSGLEITVRQRGHAGVAEWRALAGAAHKGTLFLRDKEIPGAEASRDVAVALSITHPVLSHVRHYLETARVAVHRTLPITLAPAPSPLGVRDGLHAFRLAEGIAARLRERPSHESGGTAHLFAAAPNAMLFFLGQLCQGLGKIQLYEHDFFSGRPGDYSPSILLG